MSIKNVIEIKRRNLKSIISYIRFKDDLTKKQIAKDLKLSFATVSNMCNELKLQGVVSEIDSKDLSIGRTPKIIKLNYDQFYFLCIDFHMKDRVKLILLNLRNEIVIEYYYDFEQYCNINQFIAFCYEQFEEHILEKGIDKEKILGAGVAVSGILDKETDRITGSELELFQNQPLGSMLYEYFDMPVCIDNESNLCVIAARLYQTQEEYRDNILYLYMAEGVGVGIISNGVLISGQRGYGAEICHIPIGSGDYRCRLCGHYGCVESDLSLYGFIAKFTGRFSYDKTQVFKLWEHYVKQLNHNENTACKVTRDNGIILGRLLSILVNLFDPGIIYIGGIVAEIFEKIEPYILEEIRNRIVVNGKREINIKPDTSKYTIAVGAAEMVYDKWKPLE